MNPTPRSHFVYVTFIRTTPAKLWAALTDPQFIRQYWFDTTVECGWKKGSPWKMARPDGSLTDTGEILEIDPPRRMVIRWQNEWKPELKAEGPSRWTGELAPGHTLAVASQNQPIRLRVLNALARLLGVLALLCGGYGVWCGLTLPQDRSLNLCLGAFSLVMGCAFLVTKPVTREHLDRVFGGLHKDSTDKRGPDEWQA